MLRKKEIVEGLLMEKALGKSGDAAVVLREDFRPDVEAAQQTLEQTRALLAQPTEDGVPLDSGEGVGCVRRRDAKRAAVVTPTDRYRKQTERVEDTT